MRSVLYSVGALLVSAAILLSGGGLLSTLIALRAGIEGFSIQLIGMFLSGYYVGFVVGCFLTPRWVAAVGHIRVFSALAAATVAVSLFHVIVIEPYFWVVLRLVTGICFAGLYMVIESWINERAPGEARGRVLAVYRIVDLAAVTMGQVLVVVADPGSFVLFSLVAVLISLSIVPVCLVNAIQPSPITQTRLNIRKLIDVSPLAVVGAVCVGLANGPFWGIAPIFVQRLGYDYVIVSFFMSAAIISGAIAQWPLGYVSDHIDRRKIIAVTACGGVASGLLLFFTGASSSLTLMIGAIVFGTFAMPIFAMSAAHANDHANADEFVSVASGLLLLYGLGSIVGPVLAPVFMDIFGPAGLFLYTSLVHLLLFLIAVYRLIKKTPLPLADQDEYVAVPRTSPVVFALDPRGTNSEGKD